MTTLPTPAEARTAALAAFARGFNCAEALVIALAPHGDDTAAAPYRAAAGFGGGFARAGLTCGCLTGAAIAVGLHLGRTEAEDTSSRARVYATVDAIRLRFAAFAGTTECRTLTGLDFAQEHDEATRARVHSEICAPLVGAAAAIAAEELARRIGEGVATIPAGSPARCIGETLITIPAGSPARGAAQGDPT